MSIGDKPETIDSYNFLAKQVRAMLIAFAMLIALAFLGRPDTTLLAPQVLWGLTTVIAAGAAAGFIANLAGVVILLTSGSVHQNTLHVLSAILAVITGTVAANLFAALLEKAPNVTMTCILVIVAQIAAHINISRE